MARLSQSKFLVRNNVQKLRKDLLMSKAELARKAGVSALTIERVESGKNCRMDTKRKIILALGLKLSDVRKVFFDDEDEEDERESASRHQSKETYE